MFYLTKFLFYFKKVKILEITADIPINSKNIDIKIKLSDATEFYGELIPDKIGKLMDSSEILDWMDLILLKELDSRNLLTEEILKLIKGLGNLAIANGRVIFTQW
jgi:hypothetical protein